MKKMNSYKEALDYIHSVSWLGSKPGLSRIKDLCNRLDNPQDKIKTVHITGTNGKGSTAAMIASVLKESGYKTGLFTSPFLEDFCERIQIDGNKIPENRLLEVTSLVFGFADNLKESPTEFELITAIAFEYFYEEKCDIAVIEVGMGGEFDATNVIKKPECAVITSVSLDHTEYLGSTREMIAGTKAGIIKKGSKVVFSDSGESVNGIIINKASGLGCEYRCAFDGNAESIVCSESGTDYLHKTLGRVSLPFIGEYQVKNSLTAIETLEFLSPTFPNVKGNIISGLSKTVWPGRLEVYSADPLIVLDCSHNPAGVELSLKTLNEVFKGRDFTVISGIMADKDYRTVARLLSDFSRRVITVSSNSDRALSPEKYAEIINESGGNAVSAASYEDAVRAALSGDNTDALLCIGSFYIYSGVKNALNNYLSKNN